MKKRVIEDRMKTILLVIFMYTLLILNYMYNVFNPNNTLFADFQTNSEALAFDMILADQNYINTGQWGLGFYVDSAGWVIGDPIELRSNLEEIYVTNDVWDNGYARTGDGVIVSYNFYTATYFKAGNWLRFEDGTEVEIENVETDVGEGTSWTIAVKLKCMQGQLSEEKNGNLLHALVLDADGNECPKGAMELYDSQYGLQGRVIRRLAFLEKNEIIFSSLHWVCAILTATVLALIVYQLYIKYDVLMSTVFYIVFLLSPWVVNFARNVYWLEFLWFIPMLIGLIFLNYKDKKLVRFSCYAGAFLAIFVKSLCGYEYITTIMLGLISFLLADFVMEFSLKKLKKGLLYKELLRIGILGVCALAGFLCAFLLHANLRGNGNVLEGINVIFKEDVLRSTVYGWTVDYGESYQTSMNASVWQVLKSYFYRSEEIISGIGGNFFPLLAVSPLVILLYNAIKNKFQKQDCILYIVTFLTSVSWYILGKSHSAMHGFLNYVLWYFGYIQICFYILLKQIWLWVREHK